MSNNDEHLLSYSLIRALKKQNTKLINKFLTENFSLILSSHNEIFDLIFESDLENNNTLLTELLIPFLKEEEIKNSFFNYRLRNNLTIIENLFIYNRLFPFFKLFFNNSLISLNQEYICTYIKNYSFKTTHLFLSIVHNNTKIIQFILNNNQKSLLFIDENNNTFLPYCIIFSNEITLDLLLNAKIDFHILNNHNLNQIFACLQLLPYVKNIKIFLRNLRRSIVFYKLNTNSYIEFLHQALIASIFNKNIKMFNVFFKKYLETYKYYTFSYTPLDYIVQAGLPIMLDIVYENKQYIERHKLLKNNLTNNQIYINFLSMPFIFENNKSISPFFNTYEYKIMVKNSIKYFNLDIKEKNQFGNNILHGLCSILSNDFEKYFELFKFFIEEYQLNPFEKNYKKLTPLDLIKNKEHVLQINGYLQFNKINF